MRAPKTKPKSVFKEPQVPTPSRRTRSSPKLPDADPKPTSSEGPPTPDTVTPPLKSILKRRSTHVSASSKAHSDTKSIDKSVGSKKSNPKISAKPEKPLPYTPRTPKPRLATASRFDRFRFKGPMPEKMYFEKMSIPEEKYRKALAFLENRVDDEPSDDKNSSVVVTKYPLNEQIWKNCNSRSRTALEQQKPEQFPTTEWTNLLIELNACLLTEDFKHMAALLVIASKMPKVGWYKKTLFKFAFACLLYDPKARGTGLLLSFLQGCLGCKIDDTDEFMLALSQSAEVGHLQRTPSDKKHRGEDNEVVAHLAKKSRVRLDFEDN